MSCTRCLLRHTALNDRKTSEIHCILQLLKHKMATSTVHMFVWASTF